MSLYTQLYGLLSARNHLDDQYDGKTVFRFKPLQGLVDGQNTIFQIPQSRLVIVNPYNGQNLFPQIYVDNVPLSLGVDYTITNPKQGMVSFVNNPPTTKPTPQAGNTVDVTFNYVWFDDIEWDHHLNRAANEIGFTQYYTSAVALPMGGSGEALPSGGSLPSDIPDGLFNAICLLGASFAAKALSLRFSTRYDTSAGDQSFSPSQMSKAFTELSKDLEKRAYTARDDFYKGQGRQYKPSISQQGYVLPEVTPPR